MKAKHNKISKLSCLFLLILFVTQSCVVSSLHPLYTDEDRVHLDELDGVWMEDDKTRYEITTIIDSLGNEKIVLNSSDKFGSDKVDLKEINYAIEHSSKLNEEEFFEGNTKSSSEDNEQMSKEEAFFNGNSGKKKKVSTEEENAFFEGKSQKRNYSEADQAKIEKFFFNPQLRKHYQIKIFSEKDTSIFDGKLSKLDGNYFLDVIPNEKCLEDKIAESFMTGLITRTHGFFKLDINGDELKVNAIEYDDFDDLIKKKKIRIEHVERDNEIIITAKTRDIQKFLIKFADTKMFNDPDEALILKRVKD
nr:hypothetical protein [uncultured Marinifilum sp.]